MEAVLEGMAEYFSEELSQKTKRGMEISAQKCLFTGGSLALGLKSVDRKILIDEDTAPIVRKIFDLYLSGKTMAEIIRYLNDNGIKTSKGNPYNKNSIRNILTNRRYKGIYTYNDLEIADGIPRLIDDDTFERAQIQLEKNKKAPARSKAVEDNYLLTTKLYCGHCGSVMVGVSGTSQTKKLYQYYQCVNQRRKGGCDKKSVNKALLENKVINGVFEALNNSYIETVAKRIADLSVKEGNTDQLKRIKKQLRENEVATENLIKAIEKGTAVELISTQIEKRQQEKLLLETEFAKEKILSPNLTFEQVKFYFDKYKQGDINSTEFRTSLVDTFVRKIVLSDDDSGKYLDIYLGASAENIRIPLDDFSSSKGIWHPQQDSNLHLTLRRGLYYPLYYEGIFTINSYLLHSTIKHPQCQ